MRDIVYFRLSKISEIILYHNNQIFPIVSYSETLLIVVERWSRCKWRRPGCYSNECRGGQRRNGCWFRTREYECYRYRPN